MRLTDCADVSRTTTVGSGGGANSYVVSDAVCMLVLVVTVTPSESGRSTSLILSNPVRTNPAVKFTPESVVLSVKVPPVAPVVGKGICAATRVTVPKR